MRRAAYLFVTLILVFAVAASTAEASWFLERYKTRPTEPAPTEPPPVTEPPSEETATPVHYGGWARKWLDPVPVTDPDPVASEPEPSPPPQPEDPPVKGSIEPAKSATAQELQVLKMVNDERKERDLVPLKLDLTLTKLARMKGEDLVEHQVFSHDSPTYGNPIEMLKTYGIEYRRLGENLATAGNIWVTHFRLMNSPGHRANILGSQFTHVGIGVVPNGGGVLVVELFVQW